MTGFGKNNYGRDICYFLAKKVAPSRSLMANLKTYWAHYHQFDGNTDECKFTLPTSTVQLNCYCRHEFR